MGEKQTQNNPQIKKKNKKKKKKDLRVCGWFSRG
jgi:hypothetical protein